ncbi:hypothetical protein ACJ73_03176 [Blastomyces percursus]|uniref:Uncharacterized protein n=1 Tax=Blastomyces percursus TaxID=1658174 RepID=A0A1J9QAI7_9EURO|nr:hypothetical protein ACJ73_03176 [Blastomyces percursus]
MSPDSDMLLLSYSSSLLSSGRQTDSKRQYPDCVVGQQARERYVPKGEYVGRDNNTQCQHD